MSATFVDIILTSSWTGDYFDKLLTLRIIFFPLLIFLQSSALIKQMLFTSPNHNNFLCHTNTLHVSRHEKPA